MHIRVFDLAVALPPHESPAQHQAALRRLLAQKLSGAPVRHGWTVVKRALDSRRRTIKTVYTLDVEVPPAWAERLLRQGRASHVQPDDDASLRLRTPPSRPPVVVGAGPAGLFAALTLAEAGAPPIVLERGKPVGPRARDVSQLYARGILNCDSNVCYGEGGAGTFSDGKLYTRVGDTRIKRILRLLVRHGAPADILIDNRPHLGTDRLVGLLENMHAHLQDLGCVLRFDTTVEDFRLAGGAMTGLQLKGGERLDADAVVLCTGHSARTVWHRLAAHGLPLQARAFAVGFRVEHPQAWVNAARYGDATAHLPAADYRLTHNVGSRGVYSFCMCPGGVVVTTPTTPGALCINGMSHAARRGRFANSALVVTVGPADFAALGMHGTFAGAAFQDRVERAAFTQGGGAFVAPAARLSDFHANKTSTSLAKTSYRRGIVPGDLTALYPPSVIGALRAALPHFGRTIPGFITEEASLIGVETRTASPVRVPRGADGQACAARGLYPAGEGMGYGGGIVSAALDGVRQAEALLIRLGARHDRSPAKDVGQTRSA